MKRTPSNPADIVPSPQWANTPSDQAYVEHEHDTARYDRDDARADAWADQ